VALASIVALLVTGIALERPAPSPLTAFADDITIVQATDDGIQVRRGARAFRLINPHRLDPQQRVTYSTDAQGSMGARYVDPETFNVTINRVHDAD
jgi:hypothetical protein